MDFVNNMKGKFSQASSSTVQKAKELSETAKLNSTISNAEKQISDLYTQIGYEIYVAYAEKPMPEIAELVSQVKELHKTIDDCKEQIKAINAANSCPQCGAKINKSMAFCSGCGYKIPPAEEVASAEPAPAPAPTCSGCGASLSEGAMFCTSCGMKIV